MSALGAFLLWGAVVLVVASAISAAASLREAVRLLREIQVVVEHWTRRNLS